MLGSGFMLIEVGSIQKFELFLGNPPLTLVAILSVLLVSTGVGSFYSNRLFDARVVSQKSFVSGGSVWSFCAVFSEPFDL